MVRLMVQDSAATDGWRLHPDASPAGPRLGMNGAFPRGEVAAGGRGHVRHGSWIVGVTADFMAMAAGASVAWHHDQGKRR